MRRGGAAPSSGASHTDSGRGAWGVAVAALPLVSQPVVVTGGAEPGVT